LAGFRHISTRLIVWILGCAAVALLALGTYQQVQTRRIVLEQASARTAAVAAGVKEELQGILRSIETTVSLSAANLEAGVVSSPGEAEGFLLRMLQTNARIYGATVAYEPFAAPQGVER
jgi:cytochrome c-type biogenesis protein CcmH/NrfG